MRFLVDKPKRWDRRIAKQSKPRATPVTIEKSIKTMA
jgi:hypothetical protein